MKEERETYTDKDVLTLEEIADIPERIAETVLIGEPLVRDKEIIVRDDEVIIDDLETEVISGEEASASEPSEIIDDFGGLEAVKAETREDGGELNEASLEPEQAAFRVEEDELDIASLTAEIDTITRRKEGRAPYVTGRSASSGKVKSEYRIGADIDAAMDDRGLEEPAKPSDKLRIKSISREAGPPGIESDDESITLSAEELDNVLRDAEKPVEERGLQREEDESITLSSDELEHVLKDAETAASPGVVYEEDESITLSSDELEHVLKDAVEDEGREKTGHVPEEPEFTADGRTPSEKRTERGDLPLDFSLDEIGPIDLREAEKIANEDVLVLTEEDLVEELEEFDLVPVHDGGKAEQAAPLKVEEEIHIEEAPVQKAPAEKQEPREVTEHEDVSEFLLDEEGQELAEAVTPQPEKIEKAAPDEKDVSEMGAGDGREAPERAINELIVDNEIEVYDEKKIDSIIKAEKDEAGESVPLAGEVPVEERFDDQPREDGRASLPEDMEKEGKADLEEDILISPEEEGTIRIEAGKEEIPRSLIMESLPAELLKVTDAEGRLNFIDDASVEKGKQAEDSIFEENELERITSQIVEVIEGDAKFLDEADVLEDQGKVAGMISGTAPAFQDLLIDFEEEYKFRDEEMNFVDRAFITPQYNRHVQEQGESLDRARVKQVSTAVEILGLIPEEVYQIEGTVFEKYYDKINLDEVMRKTAPGLDQAPSDTLSMKRFSYFLAKPDSLLPGEKKSIEEDLSSSRAVVFEENVDLIQQKLVELQRKKDDKPRESIPDISEKVVIMDDRADVDRFLDTLPKQKQENIRKLLKYFDNLFEKLPEDIIRNFAHSEYYDLYVNVLNDLGE